MMSVGSVPRGSFGPYEIRGPLGKGGGGEVYRAWDPRLEREVALKILHERFEGDPERVKSFVAEARAASALNHPNIVTVFDAGIEGSTPYIVSELIDGRPLSVDLGAGALAIKRLLDLATQIADGLSAAHDAGIKHGDLKPENIVVTRTGRAKIVDFGLTRPAALTSGQADAARHSLETETEPGLIAGTVPYMSPEQARGLETDLRSDQFSFGLILYEMATGHRAFRRGTPAETLDAIVNDDPPVPVLDARAPVLLKWILERCLAKDPADRYRATADLHRDLRTLRDRLGEVTIASAGARSPAAPWRWLLLVGGAMILLLLGTFLARGFRGPSPPDLSGLSFTPLVTEPGYQGFPALSPTGQSVAYSAEVDGTLQIFTRRAGSSESFQVTHERYDCKYPFWSPDGQRIYYISLAGKSDGLYSISATSGTSQVVVTNATRAAISPDNSTLAFLRDETKSDIVGTAELWLSTPDGPAPWTNEKVEAAARRRGTFDGQRFIEGTLAFSPDGKKLGLCVVPNPRLESWWQFWIVPIPEGKEYRRLASWSDPAPRLSSFTWLPDNRQIVIGVTSLRTPGSHLWMADLDADLAWPLTRAADSESYPTASTQGDQIVFTQGEPNYDVVEIALDDPAGSVRRILRTTRNESDAEVSRDGKQLVYVTDQTGQDEIWLRPRDRQIPDRPIVTQADFGEDFTLMLSAPSLSPTGDRVAYVRNGLKPRFLLRVWISTTEGALRTPVSPRAYEAMQGAPTWSHDGQSIAYPEWRDNRWNLVTMRVDGQGEPVTIRTDGVANATPHWSPNGRWITWETKRGFVLVSPDGREEQSLTDDDDIWSDTPWLVHAWSHDSEEIFGIKMTDDRRLKLVAVRVATKRIRELRDLGRSPIVNNPVKGFSVSEDGRTFVTSMAQLPGDLWVLRGLDWRSKPWWRR